MTSVTLDHIRKSFGQTVALEEIDLKIEAGEIFFLLGPSGCGKSTILRIIAGLIEPSAGRVRFGERDVTNLSTDQRNAVMCFQSYALWPHMSVLENIRFGLEIRKLDKAEQNKRAREALEMVQMAQYADRKPNQLSGGQQQRVALARALVVQPDCLLLDEPLSNLDAKLRLEMRTEIRRICRASGLTAIYVTHDQKEALSIADRMCVLRAGKIEQLGKPQDLYLHPDNRFVAEFMGEMNAISGKVAEMSSSTITIDSDIGRVTSTDLRGQRFKPGDAVTLSLRPEAMEVSDPPSSAVNVFPGELHDTIYLGESAQHLVHVQLNGKKFDTALKVLELNPRHVARDEAVEEVKLWFRPEDVIVLPK